MKDFALNGANFTSLFTPTGYTVSYQKRRGSNGGIMLSGEQTEDVLAIKAVVTCYCMPTDEAQLQQFLSVIASAYVTVYYFDPRARAYRTIKAIPSEPTLKYRGQGAVGALQYWTGAVITFTEV